MTAVVLTTSAWRFRPPLTVARRISSSSSSTHSTAGSSTRALRCTPRSASHTSAQFLLEALSILSGRIRRRHSACRRARRCSRAESRRRSAYSATSTALRARTPLSTPAACGCTASRAARRWPACSAPPARTTLFDALRARGYRVRKFGKVDTGGECSEDVACDNDWNGFHGRNPRSTAAPSAAPPRSTGRRRRCRSRRRSPRRRSSPILCAMPPRPSAARSRCARRRRTAAPPTGRTSPRRLGASAAGRRRSRSLAADARLLRPRLPARAVLHAAARRRGGVGPRGGGARPAAATARIAAPIRRGDERRPRGCAARRRPTTRAARTDLRTSQRPRRPTCSRAPC